MEAVTDESAPFLHLLKAEPTLLPAAPTDVSARQMDRRVSDEVHSCVRCGNLAQVAIVAATKLGPRWLDLCAGCRYWLETNMNKDWRP